MGGAPTGADQPNSFWDGLLNLMATDVRVADFGRVGLGVDITSAVQAAINYIRSTKMPLGRLILPPGVISSPLDVTNITSNITSQVPNEGVGLGSIILDGAGVGAGRLVANLTSAFPVFDFTGSPFPLMRNFSITGASGGLQTAAVLSARAASNSIGDHLSMENVNVDGVFSQAAVGVISDEPRFVNCSFSTTAPVSVVWDTTDVLGIGSAFASFATPSLTLANFQDTTIGSSSRSGFLGGNFAEVRFTGSCYCNLSGTATQAIELISGGGKQVNANLRVESNGATGDTSVMSIAAGQSSSGGDLRGNWNINNSGHIVSFGDTAATLSNYIIKGNVALTGSGSPTYFSANGGFYNCELWNCQGASLGVGDASHNFPYGNIVYQGANAQPWTFASPNSGNVQISTAGITTGNLIARWLGFFGSTNHVTQGSGAPTTPGNVTPVAGDIFFRTDTPGTSLQRIYICTTGGGSPVWAGIV